MAATQRLQYIDALRGLAVFGVVIVHSLGPISNIVPPLFSSAISNGARGVQLFFVVSAFTLFLSLRNKQHEKSAIKAFFVRRFFRIAPLFWPAIVGYLLFNGLGPRYWLGDAQGISIWNILSTITFTNGWHPYWFNSIMDINWTIAVEMGFYIILPFLFFRVRNLFDAVLLTAGSSAVVMNLTPLVAGHPLIGSTDLWSNFIHMWLPSQIPVFCFGIVLFFVLYGDEEGKSVTLTKTRIWFLAVTIALLALALLRGYAVPSNILWGGLFAMLAFLLAKRPHWLLVNRFWIYLGKISFSAYLTHLVALTAVDKGGHLAFGALGASGHPVLFQLGVFALTLTLTMALSTITYYWIEKPGIIFGNRLIAAMQEDITPSLPRAMRRVLVRKRVN